MVEHQEIWYKTRELKVFSPCKSFQILFVDIFMALHIMKSENAIYPSAS